MRSSGSFREEASISGIRPIAIPPVRSKRAGLIVVIILVSTRICVLTLSVRCLDLRFNGGVIFLDIIAVWATSYVLL